MIDDVTINTLYLEAMAKPIDDVMSGHVHYEVTDRGAHFLPRIERA